MSPKRSTKNTETATSESLQIPRGGEGSRPRPVTKPQQLELPFEPIPENAVEQLLSMLFKLATKKAPSFPAIKLLLDILKDKTADPSALTAEGALKILQEYFSK